MKALVCERVGEVGLRDIPRPAVGPGDVLVRTRAALTCGTDLKLVKRGHPKIPFPVTLGHEFAGEVEEAGEGTGFSPGERVVAAVTAPCGVCPACAQGRESLCASAFDEPLFGGFADFVRIPPRLVTGALRRVPDGLSFEGAALLDPLASVLHGMRRLTLSPGKTLFVAGSGPIALLFAVLAREKGARVLVGGRRAARLAPFREQAAETIDLSAADAVSTVTSLTEGRGADAVVDTTGDPAMVPLLTGAVARGGTLMLFAGMARGAEVPVDAYRIHYEEVSIVGAFHYTRAEAGEALELLAGGWVPVNALVTARRELTEWPAAFEDMRNGVGMKTAFLWSGR
jgi:L-iditol 2-dehydrogenase